MRYLNRGLRAQALLAIFLLPILFGGCREQTDRADVRPEPEVLAPATHRDLKALLASLDYDWDTVEAGVPPFILETLPDDFSHTQISERKRLFFLSMLPMVLLVNEEIAGQRNQILAIMEAYDRGEFLGSEQIDGVIGLARDYRVDGDPLADSTARLTLLSRLDVVPPSLALAQAACESGYGTSRFARLGNNLFGEWTFTPGTGIIPEERPPGETYEVRRFQSVYDSVRSYMKNLNTNKAYRSFRLHRARLRAEGRPLIGHDLASGLTQYSIRGEAYVSDIQAIIRRNRLSLLSTVNLRPVSAEPTERPTAGLLSSRPSPIRLAAGKLPIMD